MEQRLFCNKGIEMMKNCAIIVQTTIEAHTFWNKRADKQQMKIKREIPVNKRTDLPDS